MTLDIIFKWFLNHSRNIHTIKGLTFQIKEKLEKSILYEMKF